VGGRKWVQNAWMKNRIRIVCATIAFGMGIDKPDVRFVIHMAPASSISGYYQETGRAGRDGNPAECVLMYHEGDIRKLLNMVNMPQKGNTKAKKEKKREKIYEMQIFCENTTSCLRVELCSHFGEKASRKLRCKGDNNDCGNCRRQKPQYVE
jgi:bloom syndrome protein